jgi:hypothetical protein
MREIQIKSTMRLSPHPSKNDQCQKDKSVGEDVEEKKSLHTVGGNVN